MASITAELFFFICSPYFSLTSGGGPSDAFACAMASSNAHLAD
ncbi:MAG: hypothetical protein AB7P03_06440 [Kofleriaceae bacterium]